MTAAYRLKGIGWFAGCAAIVLGFYLISLKVAHERKALDALNARILVAERNIRALETEFDTRANLAQLEKWNGDTLALSAPVAAQFMPDETALAAVDVTQPLGASDTRMAQLVVPAGVPAFAPSQGARGTAMTLVAATAPVAPATPVQVAATVERSVAAAASAPSRAVVVRTAAAIVKARPQVALLDRKLLSDSTLGDILATARTEAKTR